MNFTSRRNSLIPFILFLAVLLLPFRTPAQNAAQGVPVHMIVSVEARHGAQIPNITMQDVVVNQGHDRDKVTGWTPASGANGGLDLFVLVDDSSGFSVDAQMNDLRGFIAGLPPTAYIGIGYMHNGTSQIVQQLTADHAGAAKAVRIPLGSSTGAASPYFSMEDLIKHWSVNPGRPRREIVLITSGIDLYNPGNDDPYLSGAIELAQRSGIVVYSVYASGLGHFGHSYWRLNWGQNNLSRLSDESGGEAYNLNPISAVSFKPFFDNITGNLAHQYLLTFLAQPGKKAGMQSVKLSTEVPNAELVTADRVYVPASSQP